jgi:hypothetical protein
VGSIPAEGVPKAPCLLWAGGFSLLIDIFL